MASAFTRTTVQSVPVAQTMQSAQQMSGPRGWFSQNQPGFAPMPFYEDDPSCFGSSIHCFIAFLCFASLVTILGIGIEYDLVREDIFQRMDPNHDITKNSVDLQRLIIWDGAPDKQLEHLLVYHKEMYRLALVAAFTRNDKMKSIFAYQVQEARKRGDYKEADRILRDYALYENRLTHAPSRAPSIPPSVAPTSAPTPGPSTSPTIRPSNSPLSPTEHPSLGTESPVCAPCVCPSCSPTGAPVLPPSVSPTVNPSPPTASPSGSPSLSPTDAPSQPPAPPTAPPSQPTGVPSRPPAAPSETPSEPPSFAPSQPPLVPSQRPTQPTASPSEAPSAPPAPPTTPPSASPSNSSQAPSLQQSSDRHAEVLQDSSETTAPSSATNPPTQKQLQDDAVELAPVYVHAAQDFNYSKYHSSSFHSDGNINDTLAIVGCVSRRVRLSGGDICRRLDADEMIWFIGRVRTFRYVLWSLAVVGFLIWLSTLYAVANPFDVHTAEQPMQEQRVCCYINPAAEGNQERTDALKGSLQEARSCSANSSNYRYFGQMFGPQMQAQGMQAQRRKGSNLRVVLGYGWACASTAMFPFIVREMFYFWEVIDWYKANTSGSLKQFWDDFHETSLGCNLWLIIFVCWPMWWFILKMALWPLGAALYCCTSGASGMGAGMSGTQDHQMQMMTNQANNDPGERGENGSSEVLENWYMYPQDLLRFGFMDYRLWAWATKANTIRKQNEQQFPDNTSKPPAQSRPSPPAQPEPEPEEVVQEEVQGYRSAQQPGSQRPPVMQQTLTPPAQTMLFNTMSTTNTRDVTDTPDLPPRRLSSRKHETTGSDVELERKSTKKPKSKRNTSVRDRSDPEGSDGEPRRKKSTRKKRAKAQSDTDGGEASEKDRPKSRRTKAKTKEGPRSQSSRKKSSRKQKDDAPGGEEASA